MGRGEAGWSMPNHSRPAKQLGLCSTVLLGSRSASRTPASAAPRGSLLHTHIHAAPALTYLWSGAPGRGF